MNIVKAALVTSLSVFALASGSALAADLGRPVKAPPLPPPPAPVYNWTGCYVNGGAGYGLWNIDHFAEDNGVTVSSTTTSGGRGWLGTVGGGCDYQFGAGGGFWSNWVVGAFADYDWMDLKKNFQSSLGGIAGEEKESSAWAVGGRIGYLVTPNVFTYWNGGYTESRFDQINLSLTSSPFTLENVIGAHTYHGWFVGGGTEISLSGFFGLPLPAGLFWRSEYRFSSYNSADLPIFTAAGAPTVSSENMKPYVQTIITSLVYRFNWWGH
jgi:outer membrane immunogenic protein